METQRLKPPRKRVAAAATATVDGEEDEEMKMEAFFALVRNFKEMRDRRRKELMSGSDGDEAAAEEKRKKMKTVGTVQNRSAWIPRFEREDFDEEFQVRGPVQELPKPCYVDKEETAATATAVMKKKTKLKSEENNLDLNLAL